MSAATLPYSVERVEVDVGEKRRDHAALGTPQIGASPNPFLHHTRLQPLPQELQYPSVRYPLPDQLEQLVVGDLIEVTLDVAVHHVSVATTPVQSDRLQRARRVPSRPESVRALLEVGLENRLDDKLRCRLHHPVAHRRNPQRPFRPVWLRNVPPPHRLRQVLARPEALLHVLEKLPLAPLLDHRQRFPVNAGSPSIRLDPIPRLDQDVTPADPIVERVEPSRPATFGRHVQPASELSHFIRRVVGPCGHALALTPDHRHDQSEALSLQRLLTAFIGTTSPSDSLSARRPFAFGL